MRQRRRCRLLVLSSPFCRVLIARPRASESTRTRHRARTQERRALAKKSTKMIVKHDFACMLCHKIHGCHLRPRGTTGGLVICHNAIHSERLQPTLPPWAVAKRGGASRQRSPCYHLRHRRVLAESFGHGRGGDAQRFRVSVRMGRTVVLVAHADGVRTTPTKSRHGPSVKHSRIRPRITQNKTPQSEGAKGQDRKSFASENVRV